MPPPGGFEAVKYKRNLPFRGPGGVVILGVVMAVCSYGFYQVGRGNLEKRYVFGVLAPLRKGSCQQDVERVWSWPR